MEKKDKTERAMEAEERTRKKTVKWYQMTALGLQTGGRHRISPASLRGLHEGNDSRQSIPKKMYTCNDDAISFVAVTTVL